MRQINWTAVSVHVYREIDVRIGTSFAMYLSNDSVLWHMPTLVRTCSWLSLQLTRNAAALLVKLSNNRRHLKTFFSSTRLLPWRTQDRRRRLKSEWGTRQACGSRWPLGGWWGAGKPSYWKGSLGHEACVFIRNSFISGSICNSEYCRLVEIGLLRHSNSSIFLKESQCCPRTSPTSRYSIVLTTKTRHSEH